MSILNSIKFTAGLEETTITTLDFNNDNIISVIIPQNDAEEFDPPAIILLNDKLRTEPTFQESVWQCIDPVIRVNLDRMGCSLYEAVICLTIIFRDYGHTNPLTNHIITKEIFCSYVGIRLQCLVESLFERIKACGEAEEILASVT